MDDLIIISNLNDFIFCPASIYFHKLYGSEDTIMYQSKAQLDGTKAQEKIDNGTYSTRKNILISNDKLRISFAKYLSRFGHRIQYSVFEIDNSKRIQKINKGVFNPLSFKTTGRILFPAMIWNFPLFNNIL